MGGERYLKGLMDWGTVFSEVLLSSLGRLSN